MPASRDISLREAKVLWGMAAARCCFQSDCRVLCAAPATPMDPAAPLGEMAHIIAHSDVGPRGDASYPEELRNKYENLVLLCGHHHTVVDVQPNSYTSADLKAWKAAHETWVRQRLTEEVPRVGFAELEIVTRGYLTQPGDPTADLTVTAPAEKMRRNELTPQILSYVRMGIAGANEVRDFVDDVGHIDPDFPERLRAGFVSLYDKLRAEGLQGDSLFLGLVESAGGDSGDFKLCAAAHSVVGYLFLTCEVFTP
jgi:hypothetical protein